MRPASVGVRSGMGGTVSVASGDGDGVSSGDGGGEDWNVERANAPLDAAKVNATARAMTMIRSEMSRGLVRKVRERPWIVRIMRL